MNTPPFTFAARTRAHLLLLAAGGLLLAMPARAQTAPVVADYGDATLETWVQPQYPAEERKAKREGRVTVQFIVEADGTVSHETVLNGTSDAFNAAALAAVRQWHFRPALEEAKPAPSAMQAAVVFNLEQLKGKPPVMPAYESMPVPLPQEPAKVRSNLEPGYPAELEEFRLPGSVRLTFTIGTDGRAAQPKVIFASHPAFVEIALRTIEAAQFTPAHQGPLARPSTMEYPVGFESVGARRADILAANHLELVMPVRVEPKPLMLIQPVYPREKLLAGEGGTSVVEFTVDRKGQTTEIQVTTFSAPEFDAALVAAVESWVFDPAQDDTDVSAARLRVTHAFVPAASGPDARLAGLLQPGGAGVGGAGGLDRRLAPLWRGFPVYPKKLGEAGSEGEATVEFIIDRDGRARLPRVVSASAEEFGWAAATAISQWVFERPLRGGQPVDVTVRVPVGFKPPRH